MSYCELFVSPTIVFSGQQQTFENAEYAILGASLDITSTYRSGTRFAPIAIREASLNIETYSFRTGIDVSELKIHDLGDLHIAGGVDETLRRLGLVAKQINDARKLPVVIGGEHTLTLGMMSSLGEDVTLVSLDAHLDLRNEYLDRTISHATFMRRIHEQVSPKKILQIGTRAACKEELDYVKKTDIQFLTAHQIRKNYAGAIEEIVSLLADCERIYLTVDMDVLDPAYAPAVQNPEPDGLGIQMLLDLLGRICDNRIVALDVVEVTPHYDNGITAVEAAKIIFEMLCHVEKARNVETA